MTYQAPAFTGPKAAVEKYDVISALTCIALTGDRSTQTVIMRLINLITCRYNWRKNELSIGSEEVAKLTFTSPRTAKRTLKTLTDLRFLIVRLRGRKGRVTKYGLGTSAIFEAATTHTDPKYHQFAERVYADNPEDTSQTALPKQKIIPQDCLIWNTICSDIAENAPAIYSSWFVDMVGSFKDGKLNLACKTTFIQNYARTNLTSNIMQSAINSGVNVQKVEFSLLGA